MTKLTRTLASRLTDPRKMMLVACLLGAMGLVAGYVEVQEQANRALALREGPPPPVLLQAFRPDRDIGPADEVQVLAEADFDLAFVLSLRGSNPARHAVVVPLFAISAAGADVLDIEGISGNAADEALGFLFYPQKSRPTGPIDASILATEVIGAGAHGKVISVNGFEIKPGAFTLMTEGALSVMGITLADRFIAIEPFATGRAAALGRRTENRSHRILYLSAMVLLLVGVVASLRDARHEDVPLDFEPSADDFDEVAYAKAHPKFARIPSHEEMHESARARNRQARMGLVARGLQSVVQRIRNRP